MSWNDQCHAEFISWNDQCHAEFIDGVWDTSMCACPDCVQADHDEIEHEYESGRLTLEETLEAHAQIDLGMGA
jgi:hypothetical protein